ncbi:MAG: hypothetical protein Fur0023_07570 [Bacteroidia bacterium]
MKYWLIRHIKENRYFYIPLAIFYTFGIFRAFAYSKIDNHLFFNQLVGNTYTDWFFKYLTHLGDGLFLILVVILWAFKNIRESVLLLCSYAVAGGLTAVLKNYVFDEARPHFIFDYYHKDIFVKYVDGVEILALNSFPSGHSTAAFILFSFIAFHLKNPLHQFTISVIAILVAFSRVYLSQHWLNDILAGSFIGLTITTFFYYLFKTKSFLEKMNKSILD